MDRKKQIAVILGAATVALLIVVAAFSFYQVSQLRTRNEQLQQTIDSISQNQSDYVNPDGSGASATQQSQEEIQPEAPATSSGMEQLKEMADAFIHAYYDSSYQRNSQELYSAISPYLTDSAKAEFAPGDTAPESTANNNPYQSRVEVHTTYLNQLDAVNVTTLSVCSLKVYTQLGTTVSTLLYRINSVNVNGTWLVNDISASVLDGAQYPAATLF